MSQQSVRLKQLHGRLAEIARQMQCSQFSHVSTCWRPAINAYHCANGILVCVDLAGVEQSFVEIHVEPRRVLVRGQRRPPEPLDADNKALRVLALEIDCGPFERDLCLESEVEPGEMKTEQRNGLLWIVLPFRGHS